MTETEQAYASDLLSFVREEFLQGAARAELDEDHPLIESGILDSLRIALLMTHIRDEFGLYVSPAKVDAAHFRNVRTIAGMLAEMSIAEHGATGEGA